MQNLLFKPKWLNHSSAFCYFDLKNMLEYNLNKIIQIKTNN